MIIRLYPSSVSSCVASIYLGVLRRRLLDIIHKCHHSRTVYPISPAETINDVAARAFMMIISHKHDFFSTIGRPNHVHAIHAKTPALARITKDRRPMPSMAPALARAD